MRARSPDTDGYLDHDGVTIGYEVHGHGAPTLVLLPTWTIIHSRFWKAQLPFLARHHRVVVFDGPGNGRSDRPTDVRVYGVEAQARATLAVMDATRTEQAILVSLSKAATWSLKVAADHPERVLGQVFIGPSLALTPAGAERSAIAQRFQDRIDDPSGWEKYNAHHWREHLDDFAEFFFAECFPEPHSTKQREDTVGWARETTPAVLLVDAAAGDDDPDCDTILQWCATVTSPVLVIHGDRDRISPLARGEALAEATGGDLVVLQGTGHIPPAREPVTVNRLIERFVDRLTGDAVKARVWTRGLDRRHRVLFLSSPIGLGHVRRDLALADELRRLRPGVEIDWLAQDPVTTALAAAGESVHPASCWLASESAHIASESAGHDLHCFEALRRMDEILVANFMVFQEVAEEGLYDLIVGDEAWDVDHFWHENPELKRGGHVWLTDFVGFLPMPDGGAREAMLTADYNAEMIEHIARFPRIRDRAIFVGDAADVIDESFGPDLPRIRDWTTEHFAFSGYVTGFTPPSPDQVAAWRTALGFDAFEQVCVVAVGGSGVGRALIEKAIAAYPAAKDALPELRMVVVTGPRISPETVPDHAGLEVHGYVPELYRHLSVCDLAIVQGGLTSTMELTAAKRPFLYFPLSRHFEQQYHVRHRLDRYGAGRCMDDATTSAEDLAQEIVAEIGRPVAYRDVEPDGAQRAAELIAALI
jgi:pimeloyl-ACP methyl ester carboxylesterase/predicted glycosyltransferase